MKLPLKLMCTVKFKLIHSEMIAKAMFLILFVYSSWNNKHRNMQFTQTICLKIIICILCYTAFGIDVNGMIFMVYYMWMVIENCIKNCLEIREKY